MATPILMPRMSDSMVEGTLVRWLKNENDPVKAGDILAEIETDKATQEVECFEDGVLLSRTLAEGGVVPVGGTICIIGKAGEDISALLSQSMQDTSSQAAKVKEESEVKQADELRAPVPELTPSLQQAPSDAPAPSFIPSPPPSGRGEEERLKASPLARRIAAEKGISLYQVKGTGPGGRIVREDVEGAVQGKGARAPLAAVTGGAPPVGGASFEVRPDEDVPLSNMRKTIARRLSESKATIPHVYTTVDVDAAPLADFRQKLNRALEASGDPLKISVNDLVLKAVAQALSEHPDLNAQWNGDRIIRFGSVHLSFAVSLDSGLITPTLRHAQAMGLRQLALEAKSLGRRAKARELSPEEFTGGTFTVSNMGMMGVDTFQAIINPPQAGILAVGAVRKVPVVDMTGQVVAGSRMNLTLSSDHRVVDGVAGALFLQTLKRKLENPILLLL